VGFTPTQGENVGRAAGGKADEGVHGSPYRSGRIG
jgi:hypothetical protein